ncbi:spore coat protein YsxE [Bacillus massilinigeriensis]|uniref:spore coat protein YsxE n=1 Tax=Bacillus massilionigeriensis TaxID=1805475 RepID=UPI00096B2332|nr:spore coat protein YsxE [Bacillus massilionigeriensis]
MGEHIQLEKTISILKPYGIKPYFVEDFGRIQRVYSDKGTFALKKLSPNMGTDFIRHIQFLYQKGYNRVVPIYPTNDGRYAVLFQNELYYLMPWLPNEEKEERKEKHLQLFRELARLHTLSVGEINISKEERNLHYETTINQWESDSEFLEGFIERCEAKIYMSPFELLFCLYFHDINQAIKYSINKFKEWFEKTKDQEKARRVLVHGKISTEHFLYDDRGYGYFINFENAKLTSPIHDLLPYLSRNLSGFPKQSNECVDWFYTYMKFFPLKEDEMLLLLAYFAHPSPVLRIAEKYHNSPRSMNERRLVQQLQKKYWLLKNTEYVVMKITEIENQKKQQKANNDGAQTS